MSTIKERAHIAPSHDLLAAAEAMLPEICAAADDADDARRVPDWLAQRLNDAGFFHLLTGREHGGMDADPVTAAKVIETLSTASPVGGLGDHDPCHRILLDGADGARGSAAGDFRRRIARRNPADGHSRNPRAPREGCAGGRRLEAKRAVAFLQRLSSRHLDAHRRLASQ